MAASETARVSLFMGKGGVGKTTVAAAFALDRADAGERVLLTSLVSQEEMRDRLQAGAGDLQPGDNLDFVQIDPDDLVDNIVRRLTRLGAMAEFVLNHPGYDSLLDIVPGVRELAVLNLVYNRAHGEGVDGEPYDRVVLDGVATGHGVHLLEAPAKARRLLVGKLQERAREIDGLLKDPEATEVVLVTLPEEIPVRETLQLSWNLRDRGFSVDNLVVNKWLPDVFGDEDVAAVLDALEEDASARKAVAGALEGGTADDVGDWVDALAYVRAQREENLTFLRKLAGMDTRVSLVPLLPERAGRFQRVADALEGRVEVDAVLDREVAP
jgi:anion-transporting  ArsA/GET3 family ATPase